MDEFCPHHVARRPLGVLASLSHPRFHLRFDLAHGLMDRAAERTQDGLIATEGVQQRHRLRHREPETITHRPLGARSHRHGKSYPRIQIVTQAPKPARVHDPIEAEPNCTLAAPGAHYSQPCTVIIGGRIASFCRPGTTLFAYP